MSVLDPNSLFQQQRNFVSSLPSISSGTSGLSSFLSDPVVGTIANVGSSLLGSILNFFGIGDSNEAALKAMREQNQWAYKMWKESNEYNSPSAQMARLRAAGINPALAYTNGIQNTANAASETASPAQQKAFQMPVNPISIDPLSMSQANLINAQAEDARASAKLKETQLPLAQQQILEIQSNIDLNRQKIDESLAQVQVLDADQKLKVAQAAKIKFDEILANKEYELKVKESEALVKQMLSAAGLNNASAEKVRQETKYLVESMTYSLLGLEYDSKRKVLEYGDQVQKGKILVVEYLQGRANLEKTALELIKLYHKNTVYMNSAVYRGLESFTDLIGIALGGSIFSKAK